MLVIEIKSSSSALASSCYVVVSEDPKCKHVLLDGYCCIVN